jgi:hypothetical protein
MKINATHVLLSLVLLALLANAYLAIRPAPARAAMADDLDDVVSQLDDISSNLASINSNLDKLYSIDRSLEKIAGADLWNISRSTEGGASYGLPVVVIGGK